VGDRAQPSYEAMVLKSFSLLPLVLKSISLEKYIERVVRAAQQDFT